MKRIVMFDPYLGKFTDDMMNWWLDHGHEVKRERYYNPSLISWADVVWFDTCDNNLASATKPDSALLADDANFKPWDIHEHDLTGKKVIVRPIDIEVWQGHHAAALWDVVTDCIFIAPHIRDMMMLDDRPKASTMKIHTIPCGVDLNRWTFKERQPGFNIAVVAERWVSKGVDYVLQIALKLKEIDPRYKIYWLGQNNDYHWQRDYLVDMIERHNLNFILEEEYVEDLDAWLEDKNYLLSGSVKEAFGYSIAEGMAKGIRPIIHEFFGFEPLWGDSGYTWASIDQAIEMIMDGSYNSQEYLDYLKHKGYTLEDMMLKIEGVIND